MSCDFTVCVLLYGDHVELAKRVLGSLISFSGACEFRLGFNNVSKETASFVDLWQREHAISATIFEGKDPYYKYPLMREMFHGGAQPINTPYIMWFDDDSYIRVEAPKTWFSELKEYFTGDTQADMLGKVYKGVSSPHGRGLQDTQPLWVESQAWYTGKPVPRGHQPRFCTGGWWAVRTEIIKKWNWPPPGEYHNCGDFLFGELMTQQDYKIKNFDKHVAINADAFGTESKAPRRGTKFIPLGVGYTPVSKTNNWMDVLDGAV